MQAHAHAYVVELIQKSRYLGLVTPGRGERDHAHALPHVMAPAHAHAPRALKWPQTIEEPLRELKLMPQHGAPLLCGTPSQRRMQAHDSRQVGRTRL